MLKYQRKTIPIVEVECRTPDTEERSGVVAFYNEFGSRCVMTTKQFDEMYEPCSEEE